jgi:DNA transformation protein
MAVLPGFITHCSELLASVGEVRSKRMFGGCGLYVDDAFVAIIVGDALYLKVDDETRATFMEAGGRPFVYEAAGKTHTMGYWTVPVEAMDSPARMAPWARLALGAAARAQAAKKPRARTVRRASRP